MERFNSYDELLKFACSALVERYEADHSNSLQKKLCDFNNTVDFVLRSLLQGQTSQYKDAPIATKRDNYVGLRYGHQERTLSATHVKSILHYMVQLGWVRRTRNAIPKVHPNFYGITNVLLDKMDSPTISAEAIVTAPSRLRLSNLELKEKSEVQNQLTGKTKEKDIRKELLPKTPQTKRMSDNVDRINHYIDKHWLDLEMPDSYWQMMHDEMYQSKNKNVSKFLWLNRRTLSRVFNSDDLEYGGRFYGLWIQNIPSRYRSFITINGKRTQEWDYSSLNPTLAYAQKGIQYDLDPKNDAYTLKDDLGFNIYDRNIVKEAFNAMLQSKRSKLHQKPNGIEIPDGHPPWRQVRHQLLTKHAPIADLFFTGIGGKFQRLDSDIAEAVMLRCMDADIPVLPVHDSFITYSGAEAGEFLKSTMHEVFERFTGRMAGMKESKKVTPMSLLTFHDGVLDIDTVLNNHDDYSISNGRQEIARRYFKY